MLRKILLLGTLLLGSASALADCASEQSWCKTGCEVKHLGDDAAKAGCISRCAAERALCSTKAGAESALESGKEVYQESQVIDKTIGCDRQQEICELSCESRNAGDNAAIAGCKSRCIAERAACSTSVGAGKAVDLGKDAWDGTKSFFKGLTD